MWWNKTMILVTDIVSKSKFIDDVANGHNKKDKDW